MISLVLTIITVSCGYSTSILPSVTKYIPTRIALWYLKMDTKIKNAPSLFSLQNDCLLMIFMFLNFEEIGRVDTSTTNRRDRETRLLPVLKTLTLPRVVLRSTTNESCIHSLRYLLLREIAVKEVAFPSKISETNLIMCARGLYIQPLKGLKSVSLSGCSKITDAGLASLAGGCAGLTSVHLL